MKINSVSKQYFGKALATKQKDPYSNAIQRGKDALGANGLSLGKFDSCALPSNPNEDTGVGKLDSNQADKFLDMLKTYAGVNAVKEFPRGTMTKQRRGYFGPYNRSALTLGDDKINLFNLTKPQYGSLLTTAEAQRMVQSPRYPKHLINFENELGLSDMNESPVAKGSLPDYFYQTTDTQQKAQILREFKQDDSREKGPMYIAYERFRQLESNHPLKREFVAFYSDKSAVDYDDMYTRLALAPFIKEGGIPYISDSNGLRHGDIWSDGYHFFEKFDVNPDTLSPKDKEQYYLKKEKYEVMKREYKDEIDYFKFRQFIAHKQLKNEKANINSKGMKHFADCLTGFSHWEQLVYPDAFLKGAGGRMGLPVLNYFEIQNPDSPASKLLEQKVKYHLDNYDGIRFDVGWAYINAVYQIDGADKFKWLGDSITRRIEYWAKQVKGQDYDTRNLIYEFDNAGELKFFNYENHGKREEVPTFPIEEFRNLPGMAVLTTEYEHNDTDRNGKGWMNSHFLQNGVHVDPDKYILGTCNHDGTPLRILATADTPKYNELRKQSTGALMRIFNNYNVENFNTPDKFAKAKLAELYTTKNQFIFFMDMFNKAERVDSHYDRDGWGENDWGTEDFRKRLTPDFEEQYHRAVQKGEGFNLAEILARAMEAKDNNSNGEFLRDPNNKETYNNLRAWANFLYDNRGEVVTEDMANSQYGDLTDVPDEYKTDYTQYRFYQ